MIVILGIYFSGTGNTKHCVETFVKQFDENCTAISIEDPHITRQISMHDMLVFGYPIYFSNIPKIVQDFINNNKAYFEHKQVFIIATMALFSGDGSGFAARLFKKHHAKVIGGLHLKMPDCIGDEKPLKRTTEVNRNQIKHSNQKIALAVRNLKEGKPPKEGLNFFCHIAGLLGQRLWFTGKLPHIRRNLMSMENVGLEPVLHASVIYVSDAPDTIISYLAWLIKG